MSIKCPGASRYQNLFEIQEIRRHIEEQQFQQDMIRKKSELFCGDKRRRLDGEEVEDDEPESCEICDYPQIVNSVVDVVLRDPPISACLVEKSPEQPLPVQQLTSHLNQLD